MAATNPTLTVTEQRQQTQQPIPRVLDWYLPPAAVCDLYWKHAVEPHRIAKNAQAERLFQAAAQIGIPRDIMGSKKRSRLPSKRGRPCKATDIPMNEVPAKANKSVLSAPNPVRPQYQARGRPPLYVPTEHQHTLGVPIPATPSQPQPPYQHSMPQPLYQHPSYMMVPPHAQPPPNYGMPKSNTMPMQYINPTQTHWGDTEVSKMNWLKDKCAEVGQACFERHKGIMDLAHNSRFGSTSSITLLRAYSKKYEEQASRGFGSPNILRDIGHSYTSWESQLEVWKEHSQCLEELEALQVQLLDTIRN